ncbi:cytochrome b5 [Tribonema minus]|uniref:Cytochrome b5 domain-containing protein 1 n=1 Tax=Tribonema minus TaxID=303371 RepID=A0A836C925_9STRA|nr:cytochrome b5 [Tribonema minus]
MEQPGELAAAVLRYFTPEDVAQHNCAEDCWVSAGHRVLDLTALIEEHRGPLAEPIIAAAGSDISHWFNPKTGDPKTCIDPVTGLTVAYTPSGRFIHVPPNFPTTAWRTDFGAPWWQDARYVVGTLTARARMVRIVNVLTQQEDELLVSCEDTVASIQRRYEERNAHAGSYTWKALSSGSQDAKFVPMDMEKTLEENGVVDDSDAFGKLGADADCSAPVLHIYFNDDLTVA